MIFHLLSRVIVYTAGLFLTMYLSSHMGDTYFANLALFSLFSVGIELAWSRPKKCPRFWACVFLAVAMFAFGYLLVDNAEGVCVASPTTGVKK